MRLRVVLLATLILALAFPPASAQIFDARGMAMGGVTLPSPRNEVARVNPAYRAVPPPPTADYGYAIPIPIGLIQAAKDFPELDPEDEDFDLIEVANFALNIPWAWEFNAEDPPPIDLEIGIAQNAIVLDLNEAQEFVPEEGFDFGGYSTIFDIGTELRLGRELGMLYLAWAQGFLVNQAEFDLDDPLKRVLREAEPIVGGQSYGMTGDGLAQVGWGTGLVYAREIPIGNAPLVEKEGEDWLDDYWDGESNRPRLWVGMGLRRYFGLAYARVEGEVDLTGQDPILANADNFEVDYEALYSTSRPNGFSSLGQATAVDLGAVFRWREWEFGAGIADLFADLTWKKTQVDRFRYDEIDDLVRKTRLGDELETVTELPVSMRLNGSWRRSTHMIAADFTDGPGGTSLHAGAETWTRDRIAWRAGVERDSRGKFQAGWGIGLRAKRVGLDLGFRTHSRNVSGDRQVSMGLAFVIR